MPKIKKGDEFLFRATVTRVWESGDITFRINSYGTPISLPDFVVEAGLDREDIISMQHLGRPTPKARSSRRER